MKNIFPCYLRDTNYMPTQFIKATNPNLQHLQYHTLGLYFPYYS